MIPPVTARQQIRSKALQILENEPEGLRYSQLRSRIAGALPSVPLNTINGNIWNLDSVIPDLVYKPARGIFLHTKYKEALPYPTKPLAPPAKAEGVKEQAFYECRSPTGL